MACMIVMEEVNKSPRSSNTLISPKEVVAYMTLSTDPTVLHPIITRAL